MMKGPDMYNLYAAEVLHFPEGWQWFSLDCSGKKCPEGFSRVEGAVSPKKWKDRDPATERMFIVKNEDVRKWFSERAAKEGKCWWCWGTGQEVASIHVERGTTYRTCGVCKGSGKPAAAATA